MGFAKAFRLSELNQLTLYISRPAGILWLAAAILFSSTAFLFIFYKDWWWMIALPAILLSQLLIIMYWKDAKFGTIPNLIILVPVLIAGLNALPSSFGNQFNRYVMERLKPGPETSVLSDSDLEHLPPPVRKYLHYTGSVGKSKVFNFKAVFKGSMKRSPESAWMDISSSQYDFFDDPARLFYIQSDLYGVPFDGLHVYAGNSASMKIKVASVIQVVDARGEKMNQSETVTLFNDMCLLAPATLIDRKIRWETIDATTVKAWFTNKSITISALLYFNDKGELINFVSDDRFLSADGKEYKNYRWSTPCRNYQEFEGRKVAAYGEAVWHMPGKDFSYARFDLKLVEYNCK